MNSRYCIKDKRRQNYYSIYTVSFLIMAFLVFFWFLVLGKSMVWNDDGWKQHIKALTYYAKYLRQIFRTLFQEHRLVIPQWDFHISEGADILQTLHYYVIGDPIAALSALVPSDKIHIFYGVSMVFRIYLAGIAFSELAFGTGRTNIYGILAGALSYDFSSWTMRAIEHPYFLNPMIYFPLVILGIEKIIRKEKPYVFICAVAVSAMSNFYFFYMIVVISIIYAAIRLVYLYRAPGKRAQGLRMLIYMGVMAVTGVCMAGVVLLPVLMFFLGDSRMGLKQPFHLFYSLGYYTSLPAVLVSGRSPVWLCIGISAPALLAVVLLFIRKGENRFIKILFVPCILLALLPIGGRLMNGMSYSSNRWSWAIVLLCAYVLTLEWDHLLKINEKECRRLLAFCVVLFMLAYLLDNSRKAPAMAAYFLTAVSLLTVRSGYLDSEDGKAERVEMSACRKTSKPMKLLIMTAASIFVLSYGVFSPGEGNLVESFVDNKSVQTQLKQNEAQMIRELSSDPTVRYTGVQARNMNLLEKVSNTQYYWTISNSYINRLHQDLELIDHRFYSYEGYDDRAALIALAACRYYVKNSGNKKCLPYGFHEVSYYNASADAQEELLEKLRKEMGEKGLSEAQERMARRNVGYSDYDAYENENALPLGYCYSSYLLQEQWEAMDPVQKQEAMLEAAYINDAPDGIHKFKKEIPGKEIPIEIKSDDDDFTVTEKGIVTTADNVTAVLNFQSKPGCEVYVRIEGLECVPTTRYELYRGDETTDPQNLYNKTLWDNLSGTEKYNILKGQKYKTYGEKQLIEVRGGDVKKELAYIPLDGPFSSGKRDYIVNLGYYEEPLTAASLTFQTRGIYNYKSLKVYSVPMEGFSDKIAELGKDVLENIRLEPNRVRGTITVNEPKLLCLAIPYSEGWKARIDGQKTKLYVINDRYMGITIPVGDHEVVLDYRRPYQLAGVLLSLLGTASFLFLVLYDRRNKKSVRQRAEDRH